MAGAKAYFPRDEFEKLGLSPVAVNVLEKLSEFVDLQTTVASQTTDLTALTATVAAIGTGLAEARADAQTALLSIPPRRPSGGQTAPTVVTGAALTSEAIATQAVCNLYTSGGVAELQNANATDLTKPANCFVLAAYGSATSATYYLPGQYVTGLTLTPGATYWLDIVAGQITTSPPADSLGHGSQIVGVADETGTKLFFNPQPMFGI